MKTTDDFNWVEYTDGNYLPQISEMEKEGIDFVIKKSKIIAGKIKFKENLHPNAKELYSEIVKLKSKSVFECGCAGGHHLLNINILLPKIEFAGYDISIMQIQKAAERLGIPEFITKNLYAFDMTQPLPEHGTYEYVFTNAVLMHLSYDNAIKFIQNMAALSSKYIRIIENKEIHDYKQLFKDAGIDKEFRIKETDIGYLLKK